MQWVQDTAKQNNDFLFFCQINQTALATYSIATNKSALLDNSLCKYGPGWNGDRFDIVHRLLLPRVFVEGECEKDLYSPILYPNFADLEAFKGARTINARTIFCRR